MARRGGRAVRPGPRESSAIGKFDDATRRLLNPDIEGSPLAHLMSAVREQIRQVLDAIARLAEQTATEKAAWEAEARTMQLTAIKGLAFEDRVAELVTGIAAMSGDVAEAVGNQPGSNGGKAGDMVVEVNRAAAAWRPDPARPPPAACPAGRPRRTGRRAKHGLLPSARAGRRRGGSAEGR